MDCRHVCKTCAFHDALQVVKQKEVHPPYSPDLAPAGARSGSTVDFFLFLGSFSPQISKWLFFPKCKPIADLTADLKLGNT
jgi:hypothetical protein